MYVLLISLTEMLDLCIFFVSSHAGALGLNPLMLQAFLCYEPGVTSGRC